MSGPRHDASLYRERDVVPIRRALISVSDKTGLLELAATLAEAGVEIVSTGSTAQTIRDAGQGKLAIRFDRTPGMEGALEPVSDNKFRTRWSQSAIENAYVDFSVKDGKVAGATMAAISPLADFSFDYQDLHFTRAAAN